MSTLAMQRIDVQEIDFSEGLKEIHLSSYIINLP